MTLSGAGLIAIALRQFFGTADGWLRRGRCVSVKVDRRSSIGGKALVTAKVDQRVPPNPPQDDGTDASEPTILHTFLPRSMLNMQIFITLSSV